MRISKFSSGIPKHIAIIMDGNGRWAERKGLERSAGHMAGIKVVENILKYCLKIGVETLTLYAFSTENWKRPVVEVDRLILIFLKFFKTKKKFLFENKINLKVVGKLNLFPIELISAFNSVVNKSVPNKNMQLNLALSYGGRDEINTVISRIAFAVKYGDVRMSEISFKSINKFYNFNNVSDPDILVRTGGELRVSNFLLWQIAYAEFFFTKTLWPDFGKREFSYIVRMYRKRNRKFGFLLT